MKVISELVRHFWQRGVLSLDEVEYLLLHGFVHDSDLPGYDTLRLTTDRLRQQLEAAIVAPQPLDEMEQALVERTTARRRGGRAPRGTDLTVAALRAALRAELDSREGVLPWVLRWGRRYRPCETWIDAAVVLRGMSCGRLTSGLANTLQQRGARFEHLWRACDLEPFHELVDGCPPARGRVARAFRMLLAARDTVDLGRYGSILLYDEAQQVVNLCRVQRCLLAAARGLYDQHRGVLARSWKYGMPEVPAWALLLLHNARRLTRRASAQAAREYEVEPNSEMDDDVLQAAWTTAMAMDAKAVTRLLAQRHPSADAPLGTSPLYCPIEWKLPQPQPQ